MPEFPERLLDQVMADPEAMAALADFARRQGVTQPVAAMSREELRHLASALMAEAENARQTATSNDFATAELADIPPGLTEAVFADPNAQEILKDLSVAHGWTQPPSDLPDHIKRMFVRMLIDQGVLGVEESS